MKRYVGVDLGIRTRHQAVVCDGQESRGKPFRVEVSREGFDRLIGKATQATEGEVTFVMEPTGVAWMVLAAYLLWKGHRVHLAKPQKVSDYRKFLRKHVKTDAVDAEILARLPQADPKGAHPLAPPAAVETTLKRLVKRRERQMQRAGDCKRRVHAALVMANPWLMDAMGGEKFTRAARVFYGRYLDPEKVLRAGRKNLERFWARHSLGKADPKRAERVYEACRKTRDLYRGLRREGRLPFDYQALQEEVRAELEEMERAEEHANGIEKQMVEIYQRMDPARTLEQLRGIGPVIAAAILSRVGNIGRFPNGRRWASYCGLCPRKKKSGLSDPSMPMTKAGDRLLKKYLYLAADVARQWDPDFAAYYARRYARGDHHNRIIIALARKMALRVYTILSRQQQARQPARYVLRDAEGRELQPSQARRLILEKYARSVVAPERSRLERARKGRTEVTASADLEWPSADATGGDSAPPSFPDVAQGEPGRNLARLMAGGPGSVDQAIQLFLQLLRSQGGKPVERPVETENPKTLNTT